MYGVVCVFWWCVVEFLQVVWQYECGDCVCVECGVYCVIDQVMYLVGYCCQLNECVCNVFVKCWQIYFLLIVVVECCVCLLVDDCEYWYVVELCVVQVGYEVCGVGV